jgi:hypothetical protein
MSELNHDSGVDVAMAEVRLGAFEQAPEVCAAIGEIALARATEKGIPLEVAEALLKLRETVLTATHYDVVDPTAELYGMTLSRPYYRNGGKDFSVELFENNKFPLAQLNLEGPNLRYVVPRNISSAARAMQTLEEAVNNRPDSLTINATLCLQSAK